MKKPQWEHRTRFGIQDEMIKVIHLTKEATESQISALRRKVRKLQYGR